MNIRNTFLAFCAATAAIIAVFFAALSQYRTAQEQLNYAREMQFRSYQLADGFRQTSSDLTRLVRTYAATGEQQFRDQYFQVLDIQDGKLPTPVDYYTRVYWDFVAAGEKQPRPDGERISLRELMKRAGLVQQEFALLDQAISKSDALADIEKQAMDIVGKHPGDAASRQKATEMLNSPEYHQKIAGILKPVDNFFGVLDARTSGQVRDASNYLSVCEEAMLVASGLLVVDLILFGYIILARVLRSLSAVNDAMTDIANGKLDRRIPGSNRNDEIGQMASTVEVFRGNLLDTQRLEADAAASRNSSEEERRRNAEKDRARAEAMAQATDGLATGLKHLASGDLTFQLTQSFADDFESLRADFNAAVSQLAETLGAVTHATQQIDGGTREISQSAQDLAKRTEQQAASLEETAAALDQITANVTSSSKRAEEARTIAVQANTSAAQSGAVVANAVNAMQRIEQSSNQIANIIGVIDEIAFQTNLLALNAGVEAARAGEAGKGFAVVAQEVRELAQRSAQAAKEIKGLIQNSSVEVAGGVKLVSDTGEALKAIENYIVTINHHMDAIATSAREQSVGLAEVNTAVNQMDQVTQQNAAMVEESNAASASLASEAMRLRDLVGQFQLAGFGTRTPAPRSVPASVAHDHKPAASPARKLINKIAGSFGGSAAVAQSNWEEF